MLTAKGVPFVYYGEEIGMENIEANSLDEMMDIQARTHYKIALKNGKPKEQAIKIGLDYFGPKMQEFQNFAPSGF